jgi:hypothetical protein
MVFQVLKISHTTLKECKEGIASLLVWIVFGLYRLTYLNQRRVWVGSIGLISVQNIQ